MHRHTSGPRNDTIIQKTVSESQLRIEVCCRLHNPIWWSVWCGRVGSVEQSLCWSMTSKKFKTLRVIVLGTGALSPPSLHLIRQPTLLSLPFTNTLTMRMHVTKWMINVRLRRSSLIIFFSSINSFACHLHTVDRWSYGQQLDTISGHFSDVFK